MIHSMTGFARVEELHQLGSLIWELRSVNHRYLDLSFRLPEDFRTLEPTLRERIGKRLSRGKVEVNLRWQAASSLSTSFQLNEALLSQYLSTCEALSSRFSHLAPINPLELLKTPNVLIPEALPLDQLHITALAALDRALDVLVSSRQAEGARLAETLRERATAVAERVEEVALHQPEVIEKQRERLLSRLEELQSEVPIDSARLEQEMVFAAQRLDIDEELDRLRSHLDELNQILQSTEPVGRKLDFLMQEFNREANTLSSKSSDTSSTHHAVEMKVLIEQMREQIQNIE
jgi:uncharacterized protein (TIGR00255 family)